MKAFHKHEDIALTIHISPQFRGIIRGFAHDVSEGCTLEGTLVLHVYHQTKIKKLFIDLIGHSRVNFRTTNAMGVPSTDRQEERVFFIKTDTYFNQTKSYEPGTYEFPFEFHIPPSIPHTFSAKHGSIQYALSATACRPMLKSDVHAERPVYLRRCLMDDLNPEARASQTVVGKMHSDIVSYAATAPSMVYAEGGLLKLDLKVHLKDPAKYSVRTVTCGLQENQFYRTTGQSSLANQAFYYSKKFFPLGCSSFFPSKHPDYNPAELHQYNAIFRLYPRVQTDNRSKLIVVRHELVICMIIDDNEAAKKRSVKRRRSSIDSIGNTILSHLTPKQPARVESVSNPRYISHDTEITPPTSRSPSPTQDLSGGNAPSLSLVDTDHSHQSNIVKVTSRSLSNNQEDDTQASRPSQADNNSHSLTLYHHLNPFKFYKHFTEDEGAYECRLTMPIIVTSREEYSEGSPPALPNYEVAVNQPPDYDSAIQSLPPVPVYVPPN
ncbi:hypothetical protein BD560DRAFT_384529 [Blakeslea trispora]|nr:hypothetical protein BD560DRAFT_384529 [Blakeslea trispora]